MKKIIATFICSICLIVSVLAQEFGYGFKVGLSQNSLQTEQLRDGETYDTNTGFHVGAMISYKATELMGVRAELLFAQKGGRIRFEGEDLLPIDNVDTDRFYMIGENSKTLNLALAYVEVPLVFYVRPIEWFEFHAGGYASFLGAATAVGQLTSTDARFINSSSNSRYDYNYNLTHDYRKDEPRQATYTSGQVIAEGLGRYPVPDDAGAYFHLTEDYGNLYNAVDLGLVGGVSFYINKGLFVGLRADYGLTDVTNSEADRVPVLTGSTVELPTRDDEDKNLSLQLSIGFNF